ncbi:unnamed protein product, partial [Timema podura]|nr:unnamed protein product [Timema podura]
MLPASVGHMVSGVTITIDYTADDREIGLQRYYVMKLRCPELFKIPRPSEKKYILEMQAQNMLEDRDGFGRRVYIFRVGK